MAAGDVIDQRAMGGGGRRQRRRRAVALGGREAPGQKSDRGGFHIAFAAGDLAGKTQPRLGLEPQGRVEQERRVEEGVAMQAAEPRELGAFEPGYRAEYARLLAMLQL